MAKISLSILLISLPVYAQFANFSFWQQKTVAPPTAVCGIGYEIYSTPGSYTFTVPENCTEVVIKVWGAGGGGGGDGGGSSSSGTAGGASDVDSTYIAGGGGLGVADSGGAGGAGGTATGGDTNTVGSAGTSSGSTWGNGGDSGGGELGATLESTAGAAPGGGGSGGDAGGAGGGGGGGGGGYVEKTLTVTTGQVLNISVGTGGTGGSGNAAGGAGGGGQVIITRGDCPTNYVRVQKNTDYLANSFCVMKYEAKAEVNAGGSFDADGDNVNLSNYKPSSVANDQPWRTINRNDARTECQSLGAGYDLMSNAQWQTVARNIELVDSNWTSGTVGNGCLFQGNNGETVCGYDSATDPVTTSSNARGIFTFSDGATINDIAGNLSEWVRDENSSTYGSNAYFSTITTATHTLLRTLDDGVSRSAKAQFGPSGSYSTANNNSGLGAGSVNYSKGGILRGGRWWDMGSAGVFFVHLDYLAIQTLNTIGFRCVYAPGEATPTTLDWLDFPNTSETKIVDGIDTAIDLELSAVYGVGTPTIEYSKNGGGWTAFTPGAAATVTFANNDTLAFRVTGTDTHTATITVKNTSDGNKVLDTMVGTVWDCPTNFVSVPKNTDYTSSHFCVMKYEAKAEVNAGGSFDADGDSVVLANYKPASVANDQPWRSINRDDARTECQSLGTGYDLISNAQWQTLARNLELEGANWTTGTVGSGCMFQGNNGETTCGYNSGTDPIATSTDARGIFTLSTGETINDVAGNVYEWVLDDNSVNYGSNAYFAAITTGTHTTTGTLADAVSRSAKAQFGPSGSYSTANNNSGLGYGFLNANAGAVLRGGNWGVTTSSGVFYVSLYYSATNSLTTFGFRCVKTP